MSALPDPHRSYHREAAAAHMVANIPRAHPDTPVEEVIAGLRGHL